MKLYFYLFCWVLLCSACGSGVSERPGHGDSTRTTVPEDVLPEHVKPGGDTVVPDSGH